MNYFADAVYDTLMGMAAEGFEIPGVENIFEEGKLCDKLYDQMQDAYRCICERLSVTGEDKDLETVVMSLMAICKETGRKMYHYGAVFGESK